MRETRPNLTELVLDEIGRPELYSISLNSVTVSLEDTLRFDADGVASDVESVIVTCDISETPSGWDEAEYIKLRTRVRNAAREVAVNADEIRCVYVVTPRRDEGSI